MKPKNRTPSQQLKQKLRRNDKSQQYIRSEKSRLSRCPNRQPRLALAIQLLRSKASKLIHDFILRAYAVDATSLSVIVEKKHTSRYLRNAKKYYNDANILLAFNKTMQKGYAIITKSTQITKADLEKLIKLSSIEALYTDNRHHITLTLPKKFTMVIEREFSIIKRAIYPQIKALQSKEQREGDKKKKLYTNLSIEQLVDMYKSEMEARGIKLLNAYHA